MATKAKDQLALDETVVDDEDLESALEDREKRKASLSAVRSEYETANKIAMGGVEKLELPEGRAVRVGRFRIERKEVRPRSVAFATQASTRIWITPDGDE